MKGRVLLFEGCLVKETAQYGQQCQRLRTKRIKAASAAKHSVDPARTVSLSTAISLDMDQLIMEKCLGARRSA